MDGNTVSLIQTQMNNERQNSQIYLYLSWVCTNMAYDGFAKFFKKQSGEEQGHADKFAEFLISKRIQPEYRIVVEVKTGLDLPTLTREVAALEKKTTEDLKTIYELCDDAQVKALLDWFLVEQIEEENWSQDLADLVARTNANGWIELDEQYGDK